MTKERLEQYADLRCEVAHLESNLKALIKKGPDATGDTVQSAAEFPYSLHDIPIKGFDWGDYEVCKLRTAEKLARRKAELMAEREAIEDFIAGVPDSRTRQIISYRYIEGRGWRWIANKFRYRTDSAPRNKMERFLEKNAKRT